MPIALDTAAAAGTGARFSDGGNSGRANMTLLLSGPSTSPENSFLYGRTNRELNASIVDAVIAAGGGAVVVSARAAADAVQRLVNGLERLEGAPLAAAVTPPPPQLPLPPPPVRLQTPQRMVRPPGLALPPGARAAAAAKAAATAAAKVAPERAHFATLSPSLDSAVLSALFGATARAAEILAAAPEVSRLNYSAEGLRRLSAAARDAARRLVPAVRIETNSSGAPTLREWLGGSGEADPGHRHFSHLWPLFPGGAVRPRSTPRAAAAARNALLRRLEHGGGHTGWSMAWVANLWARLGDGDEAHRALRSLWRRFTMPNLVSTHPKLAPTRDKATLQAKCATCFVEQPSPAEGADHVFQVDGLLGALSAMSEMLVQVSTQYYSIVRALTFRA